MIVTKPIDWALDTCGYGYIKYNCSLKALGFMGACGLIMLFKDEIRKEEEQHIT